MRTFTILMSAATVIYSGLGIALIRTGELYSGAFSTWRSIAYPIVMLWLVEMGARFSP